MWSNGLPRPDATPARFATVSSVRPDAPETWRGRAFLTFDLDWAHDAAIAATIDLVEAAGVAATWFVTHATPLLDRLRANRRFELGIHPNFNPLLSGTAPPSRDAGSVVAELMAIVPEATSVRSHSLVQGGRLLELFRAYGLTHEANAFVPAASGIALKPWTDWFAMVRVPYGWEDDFACAHPGGPEPNAMVSATAMTGFDFHPIHVFLNTDRLERYERARPAFADPVALSKHRNTERPGTADRLALLLECAR